MKRGLALVFCVALVALFAGTVLAARTFRRQAQLFPMVIGVVGLGLATAQVAMEARRVRMPPETSEPAEEILLVEEEPLLTEQLPPDVMRRRTAEILGWILAFTLGVWFLGFPLAVPIATLAYLKVGARESWRVSVLFAAFLGILFYGLFVQMVRIPFDEGVLQELLAGPEG